MNRARVNRRSISLDMTAMSDMAFLLLAFFMLATKFKHQEAVAVTIPSSVSENKLPDSNLITISIDKSGSVFFGMDSENTRKILLDKLSSKYNLTFTGKEKESFAALSSFGVPIGELKNLLNSDVKLDAGLQKGIPADSVNNELKDWIVLANQSNSQAEIAIKADIQTDYPQVEKVIATLQDLNINKFKLVTNLEVIQ